MKNNIYFQIILSYLQEVIFEWDEGKSAKVKTERGASFEEIKAAIGVGGLIATEKHRTRADQAVLIVRFKKAIWAVVVEPRGSGIRFVTLYQSRKWRKKYGNQED